MDAKIINPFIAATQNAFEMMAGLKTTRGAPFVKGKFEALADVSGIIGIAGEMTGVVVLSFPSHLALKLFTAMTGDTVPINDPALADVVGEMANMIAGGAKAAISEMGRDFRISIPSVVTGADHVVVTKYKGACLVVPFKLEEDDFWVQIALES